ncbi:DUF2207 domain-containing protein [Methanobrevibacter sp. OttesenSCG-928-K11]|nr:DUF2207 domain-containing protein [Methanobrevibacter sp. OttesenSCG-928-K11]
MNKKIIGILLISLFLFSTIPSVFSDDNDKSYSIKNADFDLTIFENGLLHVQESFQYSFDGEFNGVYRDIPLKSGESIKNINVSTEGAYNEYELINESGNLRIKIYLYSDEAKTQKIANQDVKVNIEYDFLNVVKIYNDVGELQYKIWGEEWDVGANNINAQINFISSDGVKYWINPYYNSASSKWDNNSIILKSNYVASGDYLEFRSVIPLDQFNNPIYANKINQDGLAEIEKTQEDYTNQAKTEDTIFSLIPIILLLSLIIPVAIYFKHGREPKINYNALYEREPPSDDSPLFVNAMFTGSIGSLDKKGFQSVIMDLINKKYISLEETSENKDINLKINYGKDLSSLKDYESGVINILKDFESEGIINLKDMKSTLSKESNARKFKGKYDLWVSDYEKLHVDDKIHNYFIDDGNSYLKVYGIVIGIISFIVLFFAINSILPSAFFAMAVSIFSIIIAVICFFLPNRFAGRWTEFGMEENEKWKNFKKYLNDFSLMKEHPPESIVIWNEYLVYATALGVADNVKKAMDFHIPSDSLEHNDLYYYHSYGGTYLLYSAMSTGFSAANPSSSGVGGVGGGSGGGGGGAF